MFLHLILFTLFCSCSDQFICHPQMKVVKNFRGLAPGSNHFRLIGFQSLFQYCHWFVNKVVVQASFETIQLMWQKIHYLAKLYINWKTLKVGNNYKHINHALKKYYRSLIGWLLLFWEQLSSCWGGGWSPQSLITVFENSVIRSVFYR